MMGDAMELRKEDVEKYFYIGGFNCAETTMALLRDFGLVDAGPACIKMMTGFGGGMQKGYLCGSAAAAVAAISLSCGRSSPDGDRKKSAEAVEKYLKKFAAAYDSVNCADLTRDIPQKTGEQYAYCEKIIETSVRAAIAVLTDQPAAYS